MLIVIDRRFSSFFQMRSFAPYEQFKCSVVPSEPVDAGIQNRHCTTRSQRDVLCSAIGRLQYAEMRDDCHFFSSMAGSHFSDSVQCTTMELPGTFGFPFPVGKKMIRISVIP